MSFIPWFINLYFYVRFSRLYTSLTVSRYNFTKRETFMRQSIQAYWVKTERERGDICSYVFAPSILIYRNHILIVRKFFNYWRLSSSGSFDFSSSVKRLFVLVKQFRVSVLVSIFLSRSFRIGTKKDTSISVINTWHSEKSLLECRIS